MIRLVVQLLWTSVLGFLAASVLASFLVVVGLVVMHVSWWWEDRRRQTLADEVEDYLRERA